MMMRPTSRRSSIIRDMCRVCRSMTPRASPRGQGVGGLRRAQDMRRIRQRRERIAQLVGERGDEFVLGAIRGLQRVLLPLDQQLPLADSRVGVAQRGRDRRDFLDGTVDDVRRVHHRSPPSARPFGERHDRPPDTPPAQPPRAAASAIEPSTPMPSSHDVFCMPASTMSAGIASPIAHPL